jgi:hypothetical protein
MRECSHCAGDDLVVELEHDPVVLAVKCNDCGAQGPRSGSPRAEHAVRAWNLRYGRLSLVK